MSACLGKSFVRPATAAVVPHAIEDLAEGEIALHGRDRRGRWFRRGGRFGAVGLTWPGAAPLAA
jgi:hypothetical protein